MLTLSDRLVEVPQGYVLVSTDVLEQYIVQSHPDEESARIAASAYCESSDCFRWLHLIHISGTHL